MAIDWHPDKVNKALRKEVELRMDRALIFLRDEVKRSINVSTAFLVAGKRHEGPPSKPGEPPHKVTGTLQKSISKAIVAHRDEIIGVYGSGVDYAIELELGRPDMAPRPYLRPALLNNRARVLRFFK